MGGHTIISRNDWFLLIANNDNSGTIVDCVCCVSVCSNSIALWARIIRGWK